MINDLSAGAKPFSQDELDRIDGQQGSEFSQGVRSGTLGMRASLQGAVGAVGGSLGQQDFAQRRFAAADALQGRAAAAAPRVTSLRDANSLSDVGDYAAGVLGNVVPSAGLGITAGLLTGGAAVPAMLAAGAAQAPFEIGDVVNEQRSKGLPVDLGQAALYGGGSAALGGIVPGLVAGKLAGKVGQGGPPMTLRSGAAGVGGTALVEGGAETGGDALKQVGAGGSFDNLDTDRSFDAFTGGVVGGGAMGALGAAGQYANQNANAIGSGVGAARDAVTGAAKTAMGAVKGAAGTATDAATGAAGTVTDAATDAAGAAKNKISGYDASFDGIFDDAKTKFDAMRDKIANSENIVGDAKGFMGKQAEALDAAIKDDDGVRFGAVRKMADDLAKDNLSPENYDKLQKFSADLSDRANQVGIAAMSKAQEAAKGTADGVKGFVDAVKTANNNRKFKRTAGDFPGDTVDMEESAGRSTYTALPDGTAKRSMQQFPRLRDTIRDEILPAIRDLRPELFEGNPETLNALADGLRAAVAQAATGTPYSSSVIARLMDITGDKTADILDAVTRASDFGPKERAEAFRQFNLATDVMRGKQSVAEVMTKSLAPERQNVTPTQLRAVEEQITKFLGQQRKQPNDPEFVADRRRLDSSLQRLFGDKVDSVFAAVQANQSKEQNTLDGKSVKTDEEGNVLSESNVLDGETTTPDGGKVQVFGGSKGGMFLHPDHDGGKAGFKPAATQKLDKVQADGTRAYFLTADDLGDDHPMVREQYARLVRAGDAAGVDGEQYARGEIGKFVVVATERSTQDTQFSDDELAAVKFDKNKYDPKTSSSALPTGVMIGPEGKQTELVLDAVKLTRSMADRFKKEFVGADDRGPSFRTARLFSEGIAAAQDKIGKSFDIPASTIIGYPDGKALTWGKAQKLDKRTAADAKSDKDTQRITEARGMFRALQNELKAGVESSDRVKAIKREQDAIRESVRGLVSGREFALLKEQTKEDQRGYTEDKAGRGMTSSDGIQLGKVRMREIEAQLAKIDNSTDAGRAQESELMEEFGRLSVDRIATRGRGDTANTGRTEIDPFGPTVDALRGNDSDAGAIFTDGGDARVQNAKRNDPLSKLADRLRASSSAPAKNLGVKLEALMTVNGNGMSKADSAALATVADMKKPSEMAAVINPLLAKYQNRLDTLAARGRGSEEVVDGRGVTQGSSTRSTNRTRVGNDIDKTARAVPDPNLDATQLAMFEDGSGPTGAPPSPKVAAAKKAALLKAASSSDPALLKEVAASTDAKALQRAAQALQDERAADEALDAINARLSELVGDPDVAYGLGTKRYSQQSAQATPASGVSGPATRKAAESYIDRVLGAAVGVEWRKLPYAGEFERVTSANGPTRDVIRLSVHSLDPMGAAYHESLHAFFRKLTDMRHGNIMDVLTAAGESAPIMNQLRKLLANEPEALKQLADPEERAAYMYQFWAQGRLTVGNQTKTVLGRVADFLRSVLGIWSNDQRALHIMEYFQSGEFKVDMGKRDARDTVHRAVMMPGTNPALQVAKRMSEPFRQMGESLAVVGGQRLRDTGIPALRELADAMKLHGTSEGPDAGFLPAARNKRAQVLNDLGMKLKGTSEESLDAALESLQTKSNAPIKALTDSAARAGAFAAKVHVRKMLDDTFDYMRASGVKVNDLGYGKDYFPRVYDTAYISENQAAFQELLTKYGVADAEKTMKNIMVVDGAEFGVEVDKPGMQHLKPRLLAHIPDAELAEFLRKDLFFVLNGYVTQAARRAEWADRFGDNGQRITKLMSLAAEQGATPEQLAGAQKFIRAVDGTLGDSINPEARRLMGNVLVYQNIRLLPLMIFSSLVDPMGIMVRGGEVSNAFSALKRSAREVAKPFKKGAVDDEMTQLASAIGTIDDATLLNTLGSSYSQGMVGDTGRKINDALFKYNLMEQYTTSMRVGATEAALKFLAKHGDGKASKHSARFLAELGLQPGDVQLDANGRPKLFVADGLTLNQAAKMKAAVNRWVDGAVLRPNAADKPLWMNDPHFVLFAHLKGFVFSFHETILKRVVHEYQNGNYRPVMALAGYVPVMIAADVIKGLLQNGGEEPEWKKNWGMGDYVWHGVERSGLLGTGQFVVDMASDVQRGGSGLGALTGPTVDQLTDAIAVIGGRGEFGSFFLNSMPANALYESAFDGGSEPTVTTLRAN